MIVNGASLVPGFRPIWPIYASINAAGNVDLSLTGEVAKQPLAHALEEHELGGDSFTIRARWTSIQSQGRRDFGLFLAAIIAGIAITALVELVRTVYGRAILQQ
jgi:hypothetical protein